MPPLPPPLSCVAPHSAGPEDIAQALATDLHDGLTPNEAARRHALVGPNRLPTAAKESWLARFFRHAREPMALLLIAAALVSAVGLGEVVDAVAIIAIVILNLVISMLQEGRSGRALAALQSMVTHATRVVRGGHPETVPADQLVPGDVVLLAAGDGVPADLRLCEASALAVDESLLTGESLPVDKDANVTLAAQAPVAERANMVFSGTLVTRGAARGVVVATGATSELGGIAAHLGGATQPTPVQRELSRLTLVLGVAAVLAAVVVFFLLLKKGGAGEHVVSRAFLVAVALAVAAVPEGLATVVTLALARGVRRMAARGAIVRRLPAVETLGATTVILTDKTGTLTENRMRVVALGVGDQPLQTLGDTLDERAARVMALCNDATLSPPAGDPLEVALMEAVGEQRCDALRRQHPRTGGVPFDSATKRMSTRHAFGDAELVLVKGAPEVIVAQCTQALAPEGVRPLDEATKQALLARASESAGDGMRMLALAQREVQTQNAGPDEDALTLVGLVGLRDPLRAEAQATIAEAQAAGITVVMVTGDHAGTARWAAEATGIAIPAANEPVWTGHDLRERGVPADPLSVRVYARSAPEQKLALVRALQAQGHVVAVTGDGVNDAPALERADIGVAMGGRGTDVAREAAALIITDDNLATVVAAVQEGRGIYDNVRKVVEYLVAGNLSEVLVVILTLALFPELALPLLPLQLLWLNLLTDGLPALALGADAPDRELMRERPRSKAQRLVAPNRLVRLGVRGVLMASAALFALWVSHARWGAPLEHARGVMFSVLIGVHVFGAFAVRHNDVRALLGNLWLIGALGGVLALQLVVLAVPPLRALLSIGQLAPREWALVLALGPAPLLLTLATAHLTRASARASKRTQPGRS